MSDDKNMMSAAALARALDISPRKFVRLQTAGVLKPERIDHHRSGRVARIWFDREKLHYYRMSIAAFEYGVAAMENALEQEAA